MKKVVSRLVFALLVSAGSLSLTGLYAQSENLVSATYITEQGEQLNVRFDTASDTVTVDLEDGSSLTLPAAQSASGARYSNGQMTFWEHQGSATLEKEDKQIFNGKAVEEAEAITLEDDDPMHDAVAEFAEQLKKTDPNFNDPVPTEIFQMQFDPGDGKPPVTASCSNYIDSVRYRGDWASVAFVLAPEDEKYSDYQVMADGSLYFLMKKNKDGQWKGYRWFLGSIDPCLTKKEIAEAGISHLDLAGIGWIVEPE